MERKMNLIPYQVVEQFNENELTQDSKISNKEMLAQELDIAKAVYLEYSNNQTYYEEDRDKEIKQTYYKNISFDRKNIHELLEKTHQNKLGYSPIVMSIHG